MKRPPRIFTEGDKRYILINGKKYYLKTKSNDKKLVSIVINNIMNKVKRRKRKGILPKKPTKLESSSSSSSSSTTPSSTTSNTYNTLTYANSYNKYQQLIADMKVEEARNELNKQKQINNAFQQTNPQYAITGNQQLAITGVPPAPPLPQNYTPQLTHLAGKLLAIENKLQAQATVADLTNISNQLNTFIKDTSAKIDNVQKDISDLNKVGQNVKIDAQQRQKLQQEYDELKTNYETMGKMKEEAEALTQVAKKEKETLEAEIKEKREQEEKNLKEAERIKKENEARIKEQELDLEDVIDYKKEIEEEIENVITKTPKKKPNVKLNEDTDFDASNIIKKIEYPRFDERAQKRKGKMVSYEVDKNGNIRIESEIAIGTLRKENKLKKDLRIVDNFPKDPYKYVKDLAKKVSEEHAMKQTQEEAEKQKQEEAEKQKREEEAEKQKQEEAEKTEQPEDKKTMKIKPKKKKGNKGHEEAEGDGLYDYELDDIMKGYKKYGYLGCFTLDEIKKINPENKKRISFFLNHDEHWMAVYLDASKDLSLEFMDPFASPPPSGFKEAMHLLINKMAPKLYLKYKINQIPQQNVRSDNCGAIAARFLMDRYAGKSFKEATNYTIEKSEKKAETLRAKFGYGIKPFTFI